MGVAAEDIPPLSGLTEVVTGDDGDGKVPNPPSPPSGDGDDENNIKPGTGDGDNPEDEKPSDDEMDERNGPTSDGDDGESKDNSPSGEKNKWLSESEIADWFLLTAVVGIGLLLMSKLKFGYGRRG